MKWQCLMVVTAGLLVAAQPPDSRGRKELAKLQGTWTVAEAVRDGKADDAAKGNTVTIEGDRFTTRAGSEVLREGTLKLDPTKSPKTVNATYTRGPNQGKTALGVYRVEGDTWTLFYSVPGKPRPTSILPTSGQGQLRLVLRRTRS
jgi:uncharacterized protein (TIGR03067 family)